MVRLLAILMLILAGIPGVGVGVRAERSSDHACGHESCGVVVATTTCCGGEASDQFCPMSGGPCHCGVAPAPTDQPHPDAPFSRTDREAPSAVIARPARVVVVPEVEPGLSRRAALCHGPHAGLTHNEIRALLGVWRT